MRPDNSSSPAPYHYDAYWELIIEALELREKKNSRPTLLELCCGSSEFLHYIASLPDDRQLDFDYCGIDLNAPASFNDCQRRWRKREIRAAFPRQTQNPDCSTETDERNAPLLHEDNLRAFYSHDALADDMPAFMNTQTDTPVSKVDMLFCRIPFTPGNDSDDKNIFDNIKTDWRFINSAMQLLNNKESRAVFIAPMRTLELGRTNDYVVRNESLIKQIESITLLEEGWDCRKSVKVALIVLSTSKHETIQVVNAATISKGVVGRNRNFAILSTDSENPLEKSVRTISNIWKKKESGSHSSFFTPSDLFVRRTSNRESFTNWLRSNACKSRIEVDFSVSRGLSKKDMLQNAEGPQENKGIICYYITASDLIDGEVASQERPLRCIMRNEATNVCLSELSRLQEKALVVPPAILISRNGYPFKMSYVGEHHPYWIIPSDSIYVIKTYSKDERHLRLCFAYLASAQGQMELRAASSGSAISQISQNAIKNIALPSYESFDSNSDFSILNSGLDEQSSRAIKLLDEAELVTQTRQNLFLALDHWRDLLKDNFDIDKNTRISLAQKDAMGAILTGKDVIVTTLPESNASLAYQAPAVALGGTTIVISFSSAYAEKQVEQLKQKLHPAFLNTTRISEWSQRDGKDKNFPTLLEKIKNGEFQILYITPGCLSDKQIRNDPFGNSITPSATYLDMLLKAVKTLDIPCVVVEKPHYTNDHHTLSENYARINTFIGRLKQRPVVAAFTTLTTPAIKDGIVQALALNNPEKISPSHICENICLSVVRMPRSERIDWCLAMACSRADESGVLYCATSFDAEAIYDALLHEGIRAGLCHNELPQQERDTVLAAFAKGEITVLVTTAEFSTGIDVPTVRYAICCSMPSSIESYYQQIATAGRDGKPADSILLWDKQDLNSALFKARNSKFITDSWESEPENLVWRMYDYCTTEECRNSYILRYLGGKSAYNDCRRCDNCMPTKNHVVDIVRPHLSANEENELFAKLDELRTGWEDDGTDSIPTDRVLRDICRENPRNMESLMAIPSLSDKAIRAYGSAILSAVAPARPDSTVKPIESSTIPEMTAKAILSTIQTLGDKARFETVLAIACKRATQIPGVENPELLPCWGSAGTDLAQARRVLNDLIRANQVTRDASKVLHIPS